MPRQSPAAGPRSTRRPLLALAAVTVLSAVAGQGVVVGTAAATTTPVVSTTSVAVADAAVRQDAATTAYGTATTLKADGSPLAESYLRFSVSGHSGPVTKAVLQVYSNSTSDTGVAARPVTSGWAESSVTWATRPTTGEVVAKSGATREGSWASIDVTPLVRGDGTVDVALTSTAKSSRSLRSRETGTYAPRLLVESTPVIAPLRITPTGGGTRDGSSWANAGTLADLPKFVAARPNGGEIWVRGDAGAYKHSSSIAIRNGGTATAPVVIRGVDANGAATVRPEIVGTRTAPYSPTGADGGDVFKLYSGAKNVTFSNLAFRNEGIVFNAGGNASNITIDDVTATNVRRFFANYLASGETTANVTGLTMRRVQVHGFSKGVLRIEHNSSGILLEDVVGDSQRQDKDDFAMGVHLDDTAHNATFRRVTMRNAHDSLHEYWNGDGFATERGNYGIRFEDTLATGNTDGGYDLKSTQTTLVRARAEDNKRNFRLWGTADVTVTGCVGLNPNKRGGSSSQAQVWVGANAKVTMSGCTLSDSDPDTIVFDLDTGATVSATATTVTRSPESTLRRLASGATLCPDARARRATPPGPPLACQTPSPGTTPVVPGLGRSRTTGPPHLFG